jgi:hypothetical protein
MAIPTPTLRVALLVVIPKNLPLLGVVEVIHHLEEVVVLVHLFVLQGLKIIIYEAFTN